MAIPTLRTEIKSGLIIALWAVFSLGYFSRFTWPGSLSMVFLLLFTFVILTAAWGYGAALLSGLRLDSEEPWESALFSAAAGFGILSLLMVLAGVFGLWSRGGAVLLVALGILLGLPHYKKLYLPPFSGTFPFVPSCLIAVGVILSFLITFTPVTYYDSLVYHLALPQAYIQAGRWIGQQELIYSAFPQTMEMIWTLGMLLADDTLANLLGWMVAMLGLLAVFTFGRRFFNGKTAVWSAALLSVMPAYLLLSSGGYIDVGLAVFSFFSFYVLCLWMTSHSLKHLALAGFFAGCAIGAKYTGAIPLGIGMLMLIKETRPLKLKTLAMNQAVYAGMALLVFSPWLIKNLHYFGNPVFPFFYSWSFKPVSPWLGDAAAGYFRGLTEYAPRSAWQLLKLLWDIAVNGLNFGGGMDVLGDLGWAPLFALLPAVWLARKPSSMVSRLLLYSACFFIPWGMSRPVLRFLMPLAPFLALAAAYGYDQGMGSQTRGVRILARIFLTALCLSGFHVFFEVADALSLFKVPLGFQSRTQYLSEKLNYFDAAAFINQLPEDSLTYVVGDQRGYYYNRPVLVTPVFNTNPLTGWANGAASAEDFAAQLQARGITHLLVNHSEFKRLDSHYHLFPFTPKGQDNWNKLCSRLAKPLYRDAHCEVLALPARGAPR